MKKLFLKTIFLILPFAALFFIILLFPLSKGNYNLSIIDKNELLSKTNSPKLILLGGSNLAFGIDSEKMQSNLHIPVVNMAVHAGFGLGRILDDTTPYLKAGDILIISPEYSQFCGDWDGDSDAFNLIVDAGFFKYKQYRLLFSKYYNFPKHFGYYFNTKTQNFKSKMQEIFKHNSTKDFGVYSRYAFNDYGDVISHLNKTPPDFDSYGLIGKINRNNIDNFNNYIKDISKRNIHILITYPCYEAESFDNSKDVIYELDAMFTNMKNVVVISNPDEYRYLRNYFYDTPYHLNAIGREMRTQKLIEDIVDWKNIALD